MADIVEPKRNFIYKPEVAFEGAVSEGALSRLAAQGNFINYYQMDQANFNLNGRYNIITTPFYFGDGYITYPSAFEIVDVMLFTGETNGTGGTTEIDLKWIAEGGVSYASIFTTTPKYSSAAAVNSWCRQGVAPTGFTAPVISKFNFNPYDVIKLDVLQAVTGPVNGAYVKVFIRPRDGN